MRDGIMRTVWLSGRWAVKVPAIFRGGGWRMFLRGLIANMTERDIWEWSATPGWGDEAAIPRRYLARVVWGAPGGWMLIMERAERVCTRAEYDALPPLLLERMTDGKPDNVGVFPDGPKVIDYGDGWGVVESEMEKRGLV